jgi:hypothetical protein
MRPRSLFVASALAAAAVARAAQENPPAADDDETRKRLEAEIAKELGATDASPAQAPQPAQPQGGSAAQGQATQGQAAQGTGATGGNPMARLLLLPDISAIGSFALAYDRYDVATLSPRNGPFGPPDTAQPLFQEVELGLQSVVDPYARADLFISFTPEGVDLEEGYLTTLSLPAGLQVRAGKLFSPFGRLNTQHPHAWDFVDAPLAARLVAAEKLSGPGADVAWLAPLPWFAELHVAYQATAPEPGDAERPTAAAHLQQYFALGDATTLGVGVSAAVRDDPAGTRDLGDVSAYLRVRPPTARAYVTLQGELYGRRFRGEPGGTDAGGYAQLFWRPGPFWGWGVRYDDAPAVPAAGAGRERRYGALASWYPSEFSRLRLQLSYDRRPDGGDGLETLLALEFIVGSHGAHPF